MQSLKKKKKKKTSELKELEPAHLNYYAHTNLNPTFDFGVWMTILSKVIAYG